MNKPFTSPPYKHHMHPPSLKMQIKILKSLTNKFKTILWFKQVLNKTLTKIGLFLFWNSAIFYNKKLKWRICLVRSFCESIYFSTFTVVGGIEDPCKIKKGSIEPTKNLITSRRESGIFYNINFQLSKLKVNAIVNVIFLLLLNQKFLWFIFNLFNKTW